MSDSLENRLKSQARSLGFDLVGIAPAVAADGFDRLRDWLAAGYAGSMNYLHKHAEARRHPHSILPNVRTVVMVAMSYHDAASGCESASTALPANSGRVARYALGADYHDVLWRRLEQLLDWLQQQHPGCVGRGVADSAPLLERDFARRAGLGWVGKNTLLINRESGSYTVLGALLVDIELKPDAAFEFDHCGTCTACLDACPTQAFVSAGVLDARRCISYLTIEQKDAVPLELRRGLGDWMFGCDVCQEVCPWNNKALPGTEPLLQPQPAMATLGPLDVLELSEEEFRRRFRHTALWRPRRRGLLRNAAIVLGNTGDRRALPVLKRTMTEPDPIVRESAAWAIAEIEKRHPDSVAADTAE